jgi:hypothetical protein
MLFNKLFFFLATTFEIYFICLANERYSKYEPRHDKTNIVRLRPAWIASAQSDQDPCCSLTNSITSREIDIIFLGIFHYLLNYIYMFCIYLFFFIYVFINLLHLYFFEFVYLLIYLFIYLFNIFNHYFLFL